MRRLVAVCVVCAACNSLEGGPAAIDARSEMVELSGGTMFSSTAGRSLTVSFVESPELTTVTDETGQFTLMVPSNVPLTPIIEGTGVTTIEQTMILHHAQNYAIFRVVDPELYAGIVATGPQPVGGGVLSVEVRGGTCNIVGAHLEVPPFRGRVVYAQADARPNTMFTAIRNSSPAAYAVGVEGTVTPRLVDVPPDCTLATFPFVNEQGIEVLGPVAMRADAYHHVVMQAAPP